MPVLGRLFVVARAWELKQGFERILTRVPIGSGVKLDFKSEFKGWSYRDLIVDRILMGVDFSRSLHEIVVGICFEIEI